MQPDLDNLKKRITESRDLVDRLIGKLPGYTGYVEHGEMYEADRVVRFFLAERLAGYKNAVMAAMNEISKRGDLSLLGDVDSLNTVLERAHKKVKYADYITSGSFSKMKITGQDADRILEYDWRMIAAGEEIGPAVERLSAAAPADVAAVAKEIKKQIEAFEKSFDDRRNTILEVI